MNFYGFDDITPRYSLLANVWNTINNTNDGDLLNAGDYKIDASGGSFTILLNGIVGQQWNFVDTNNTLLGGSNELVIGTVDNTFTDINGNYVSGPFIIDTPKANFFLFKTADNIYDIVL